MEKEEIPLDYFYFRVDHFAENDGVMSEGEFGDYMLLLRYRSGILKTWDIGKMKARWIEAR